MRIKRSIQLSPLNGTVHLYWRCHNGEFYLQNQDVKALYMGCLEEALKYKDQYKNCKIHAFCLMSNHGHQAVSYENASSNLSNFMRYSNSLFGARYNRVNKRSGKVAEGRPKTPLIQDINHAMRVQFYIEANPIRAGICTLENLKDDIYCSYGFYAYGIKSRFTSLLTPPEWYQNLGKTAQERQQQYRKLFKKYLETYSKKSSTLFKRTFIGEMLWVEQKLLILKRALDLKIMPQEQQLLSTEINSS